MMNLYLGLDISISGTGLVAVDDDYNVVHSSKLAAPDSMKDVERLYFIQQLLKHNIEVIQQLGNIIQCVLEIPAYQAEGRLVEIGEITGIEKLELYLNSIIYVRAAPLQLKKYASGIGKGTKSLILLDVYKNFGVEFRDDNEADAYVLARIAHDYSFTINNKEINIKKYQQEVIDKLVKSNKVKTLL